MIAEAEARQLLDSLVPAEFVDEQRRAGRAGLSSSFVHRWAERHRVSEKVLEEGRLGPDVEQATTLFWEVTYPMAMQERSEGPFYYPYTSVNVLDWFMEDSGGRLEELKRKSVEGIAALVLDFGRFETHSLIGYERFHTRHFESRLATARIEGLRHVYAAVCRLGERIPGSSTRPGWRPRRDDSLMDYAIGPGRLGALVRFSCLPQTEYHDEVLFLRAIHISELCFYGVRLAIEQAMRSLHQGAAATTREHLEQASAFAEVLRQVFLLLRTMPPDHFLDFRDATAQASAVHSRNFQALDVCLFGLSEHKIELYKRTPHLRDLLVGREDDRPCLRDVMLALSAGGGGDARASVIQAARTLDRKLLSWRGLHLAFAVEYLATVPLGTGGTSGAPYLRLFLRDTLFEETRKEFDADPELFETIAHGSGHDHRSPGPHIAPARDQIAPDTIDEQRLEK